MPYFRNPENLKALTDAQGDDDSDDEEPGIVEEPVEIMKKFDTFKGVAVAIFSDSTTVLAVSYKKKGGLACRMCTKSIKFVNHSNR